MKDARNTILGWMAGWLVLLLASPAFGLHAERVEVSNIIEVQISLSTTVTIETELTSGSGDPYLRILDSTATQELAGNDDNGDWNCNGFWCVPDLDARVTFTPPSPGIYTIMIHSKTEAHAGRVNLYVGGGLWLSDIPFGGEMIPIQFSQGDWFRATSHDREPGCNRTRLYLLTNPCNSLFCSSSVAEGDHNFIGPNFNAFFTSSTAPSYTGTDYALVGLSPWPTCPSVTSPVLLTVDGPQGSSPDADIDGLSDGLEALLQTNPNDRDSDADGIPDYLEVHGNDGFSYATGNYHSGTGPTPANTRNVYVDILWLDTPTFLPMLQGIDYDVPLGVLQNITDTFLNDSPDGMLLEFVSSTHVPMLANVAMDTITACTNDPNCISVPQLKALYYTDVSKHTHFHVAVMTTSVFTANGISGSSGLGEFGGNDFIVASGQIYIQNTYDPIKFLEGTIVHEIGHNFGFTHNFNDSVYNEPWSTAHPSVMNYRYQRQGVAEPIPMQGPSTYSNGAQPCNTCTTSTKGYCVTLHASNICDFIWIGDMQIPIDWKCDCDVDEWGTLSADLRPLGSVGWSDGVPTTLRRQPGPIDTWRTPEGTLDEMRPPSRRQRRAHLERLRAQLDRQELIEGIDYQCNGESLRCYMH